MEPLAFNVKIAPTASALQFGDACRIELWSLSSVQDRAEAVKLIGFRQKNLCLRFYLGGKSETLICEFLASIAALQSALRFTKEYAAVKFDVAETEVVEAAKLIGYDDKAMRLMIEVEGDKRQPKAKESTPYGAFWQALDKAGFHNRPDVRRWIECRADESEWEAKERLRYALGVKKRSMEASPELLLKWLNKAEFMDGAISFVETLRFGQHNEGAPPCRGK